MDCECGYFSINVEYMRMICLRGRNVKRQKKPIFPDLPSVTLNSAYGVTPLVFQHSRSQALIKEEGCGRLGEPT